MGALLVSSFMSAQPQPSVAIIGTGFGGLGMAIRLLQAGYTDITVFEKADDVGGVWRENTYPGAACDIPSHLYSFSFEPKADWSRRFAPQAEIHAYLRHCAETHDVRRLVRFNTEVLSADFDEDRAVWDLELSDGGRHSATVLVTACGQLSRPARPSIPGLESFRGQLFHSARWRPDADIDGRRVAVIGTGASAIQVVPQVARRAEHLTLFQRQAAHVIPKPDYAYPSIVQAAFAKVPGLLRSSRWATYWQHEVRALAFTRAPSLLKVADLRFRRHMRKSVRDPGLRRVLEPTSPVGCKRILISNDYYPALARPDVAVVPEGIARIETDAVVTADGARHRVDTIVLGTGFTATDFLAPMRITGRGGRELNEAWRDGAEAHLGITVAGFPNLFMLYGPNTNLGHSSIVFMLESQIRYARQAIDRLGAGDVRWIDVRERVLRASSEWVQSAIEGSAWDQGCTSWYRTASGRNTTNWPGFTLDYWRRTRSVRWADFHLERATGTSGAETPSAAVGSPRPSGTSATPSLMGSTHV